MNIALVILALLLCYDVWSTRKILKHPEGTELNPFIRFIIRYTGYQGFAFIKMIIFLLATFADPYILAFLIGLYIFIDFNNYKVIKDLYSS